MKKLLICTFILLTSLSYSQESAFDGTQDITVEEEAQAGSYIHGGRAQKIYSQECSQNKGGFENVCTDNQSGDGSTIEKMLPFVTQAYSMILAGTGGKLKGKDGSEKTDFCKYIPAIGTMYGQVTAKMNNDQTQQNYVQAKPQAKQAASLYAVAKQQKDLSKSSKMQASIWAAGGACYAGTLVYTKPTKTTIAKMAGSFVIAYFYNEKAKAHEDREELVKGIAAKLPNPSECNPITDTSCFCNEETSFSSDPSNFQKFCVPKPLVPRNKNNTASICVDSKGKADINCGCKKEGKCIDKSLKIAALKFGLNPTLMKDPLAGIKPLSQGFGSGNLEGITNKNLAHMRKALAAYKPEKLPSLNKSERSAAKSLVKLGIPKFAAAVLAKSNSKKFAAAPNDFSSGLGGTDDLILPKTAEKELKASFQSGSKIRSKRRRSNKSLFGRKKKAANFEKNGSIQIEDYATKAQREAEITTDKSKIIFDVISYRYKMSAWKNFVD